MKTVQEVLQNANEKELIDNYLATYPSSLDDFDDDVTVGDARKFARLQLHQFIDKLRNLQIKKSENQGIFFVSRTTEDGDIVTNNLVFLDDLKKYGLKAYTYAYEFSAQAEIMGWWVADNKLTQYYLVSLLVGIMEEASFFGYQQEGLQKEKDLLEDRAKEVKENKVKTVSFDEVAKKFNFDQEGPKEKELKDKVLDAQLAYNQYSYEKELTEIIKQLDI